MKNTLSKDSAEIVLDDWVTIAKGVVHNLMEQAEDVVILHGKDAMQYTAVALSFMIQGLSVPVV